MCYIGPRRCFCWLNTLLPAHRCRFLVIFFSFSGHFVPTRPWFVIRIRCNHVPGLHSAVEVRRFLSPRLLSHHLSYSRRFFSSDHHSACPRCRNYDLVLWTFRKLAFSARLSCRRWWSSDLSAFVLILWSSRSVRHHFTCFRSDFREDPCHFFW